MAKGQIGLETIPQPMVAPNCATAYTCLKIFSFCREQSFQYGMVAVVDSSERARKRAVATSAPAQASNMAMPLMQTAKCRLTSQG
eukprot:scaffold34638_cov161-Amphora_coffeaeformis.AAC.13